MTAVRRSAGLLLAGLIVVGCGVPAETSPTKLERDGVRIAPPSTTTSLPPTTPKQAIGLCLVADDRLTTLDTELVAPATAPRALAALAKTSGDALPPSSRSLITGPDLVTARSTSHGVARVVLNPPFLEIPPADQILAIAQIVCTLTGVPGVGQVQFLQDGRPVSVPRADSSLTVGPVSRDDYEPLLPTSP